MFSQKVSDCGCIIVNAHKYLASALNNLVASKMYRKSATVIFISAAEE